MNTRTAVITEGMANLPTGQYAIRLRAFRQLGGFEGWRAGADSELSTRLMMAEYRTGRVGGQLFFRRNHGDNLTGMGQSTGSRSEYRNERVELINAVRQENRFIARDFKSAELAPIKPHPVVVKVWDFDPLSMGELRRILGPHALVISDILGWSQGFPQTTLTKSDWRNSAGENGFVVETAIQALENETLRQVVCTMNPWTWFAMLQAQTKATTSKSPHLPRSISNWNLRMHQFMELADSGATVFKAESWFYNPQLHFEALRHGLGIRGNLRCRIEQRQPLLIPANIAKLLGTALCADIARLAYPDVMSYFGYGHFAEQVAEAKASQTDEQVSAEIEWWENAFPHGEEAVKIRIAGRDFAWEESQKLDVARFSTLMQITPGMMVAELGCGIGRVLGPLAQMNSKASFYGFDSSPKMIDELNKLDPVNLLGVLGDGRTIPLDDAKLDRFYSVICLQHLPPKAVHGYVHEIHRTLKPGGRAFLQFVDGPQSRQSGHIHYVLNREDMRQFAQHAGFENIRFEAQERHDIWTLFTANKKQVKK